MRKITSVDLIYQVVHIFIECTDLLGNYVFSSYRAFKLIPLLIDTTIEFIYGPCMENQIFLGRWKKFIKVLNTLICDKGYGTYQGVYQEAKAKLVYLSSVSQVLLAIVDIQDQEAAKEVHEIVIDQLDIDNLINKMIDIYIFRIGGCDELRHNYDFNIICNHWKRAIDSSFEIVYCVQGEFCQQNHLTTNDIQTIQSGFNIFRILMILKGSFPDHPKLAKFQKNFFEQ